MSALGRFARVNAGSAFLLIVAGALVTSTGSGLAVPDWPLSFGRFFPPLPGGVLFEHGHRVAAAAVGLMTLCLAVWTWLRELSPAARAIAAASAGGILLQALLGGATVLLGLSPLISIAHACLGQTVFCLLVALAELLGPARLPAAGLARPWALAAAAVYLQLVLGAVLRHTGAGLALHALWALAACAAALRAAYLTLAEPRPSSGLHAPALLAAALVLLQLPLGLAAYLSRIPSRAVSAAAAWPTAHVACGAALLGLCVACAVRSARRT